MNKFIPYEKLSKKKKRELDAAKRTTWGALNPVTRRTPNPRAYDRQKARRWKYQDHPDVPSAFLVCFALTPVFRTISLRQNGASGPFPGRFGNGKE